MLDKNPRNNALRSRTWIQVVRMFGGLEPLAKRLGISSTRLGNWIRQPEFQIPLECSIVASATTGLSLDALSPHTREANAIFLGKKLTPFEMIVENILVKHEHPIREIKEDRLIMVDESWVLITGLSRLERYKAQKIKTIKVKIIDLVSILLGLQSIDSIGQVLLPSELSAIGLSFEQMIGDRQGWRSDLAKKHKKTKKNIKNDSELRSDRYEVPGLQVYLSLDEMEISGLTVERIALVLKLSSKDIYYRLRSIYLNGNQPLMDAVDSKLISIDRAAKIAKSPQSEQMIELEAQLSKKFSKTLSHKHQQENSDA